MKIYLFDSAETHENLLPLSFLRPLADFRCGILTIREKWEKYLPGEYGYYPVEYLREKFGTVTDPEEDALFIAGNLLPRADVIEAINALKPGQAIVDNTPVSLPNSLGSMLVYRGSLSSLLTGKIKPIKYPKPTSVNPLYPNPPVISFLFDIFLRNAEEIIRDFQLITKHRKSQPLPECVRKISSSGIKGLGRLIFIEEGAKVECASINLTKGPVYIGKDAVLMEGANIRGPFALCANSEVKMGAKIYEGTTIGPRCKVGGEISNSVFFGFSNKAHDGFLGNAVIGEWCNIGAGANASNLKNDYSFIRLWNYATNSFMKTDLQFCGLMMGDHSKIGVNCMINTATVMGVGVNVHGPGFPRNYLCNFSEGSPATGFTPTSLKKFLDIASRAMARRDMGLSEKDLAIFNHIYDEGIPEEEKTGK